MTRATRDVLLAFLLAVVSLVLLLEIGGGPPQKAVGDLPNPGDFIGWAVPFTKLLTDASAVLVIGFLAGAVFLLPSSGAEVEGLSVRAVRIAARWASVWAVASIFYFFVKVGDTFAAPLTGLTWPYVSGYAQASEGRAILLQALLAGVVAVGARWTLGTRSL